MFICLRNFKCNKVKGHPGKILSKDEIKEIGEFMPSLLKNEILREEKKEKPISVKEDAKELLKESLKKKEGPKKGK